MFSKNEYKLGTLTKKRINLNFSIFEETDESGDKMQGDGKETAMVDLYNSSMASPATYGT